MKEKRPKRRDDSYYPTYHPRQAEPRAHKGSLILFHFAKRYALDLGNTPTLYQDRISKSGALFKREVYANSDGRSALHVQDDYGESTVSMTHVGGTRGIVTFVRGVVSSAEYEFIVHPGDSVHVSSQLRQLNEIDDPGLHDNLYDQLSPLLSDLPFPKAYERWYEDAFLAPFADLKRFVASNAHCH